MTSNYIALIGDAVRSRDLPVARRRALQQRMRAALADVNRRWRRAIAARFAVALGDQFEGLLVGRAGVWEISHWLRAALPEVEWVIACGRGRISTPLAATAAELDGPCFHRAREALEQAKGQGLLFAFSGLDPRLDGLARYYSALYRGWTDRQREAARWLRVVGPAEAAKRLKVDRSAVSHLARRMGWKLVAAGDAAFRRLLEET